MRGGSSAITKSRAAGPIATQPAISSSVLPQPSHQPVASSITQMPTHGLVTATGATSLSAKPWGTSVDLDLQGLPQGEQFLAWLVSPEGERQQVATWGSTGNGEAHVTGAAAFVTREVAQVRVTDSDGDLVLSATTR